MEDKTKKKDRKKAKIIIIVVLIIIIIFILLRSCSYEKRSTISTVENNQTYILSNKSSEKLSIDTDPNVINDVYEIGRANVWYENKTAYFEANYSQVTFLNEDGSVLKTVTVRNGDAPSFDGELPESFVKWDKELVPVNEDCIYKAIVHHHKYVETVVKPTCEKNGYTVHTCLDCQNKYIDNVVKALGHDFESYVNVPSCTDQGSTVHICSRCGYTYDDKYVKALGHDFESSVIAPTCIDQGNTVHICYRCGYTYNSDYINPLGHDHQYDRDNVVDDNGVTKHYEVYKCSICGDEYEDFVYADFAYVGAVQAYTVEKDGIYQAEVWGARGGAEAGGAAGGNGGYVKGEVELHAGDTIYVVVGGQGVKGTISMTATTGGYNGGGKGGIPVSSDGGVGGSGGGATSIAFVEGTLVEIGKDTFDEKGLMVAGGGGGQCVFNTNKVDMSGGAVKTTDSFGQGLQPAKKTKTGSLRSNGNGGGGGGYYGGVGYSNVTQNGNDSCGAGGTSWVNEGLISNQELVKGGNNVSGNGKATLTFVSDIP